MQVPVFTPVTVAPSVPLTVHMVGVVEVNTTGLFEPPPVADRLPVLVVTTLATLAKTMGAAPKTIVCGPACGVTLVKPVEIAPPPRRLLALT